MLEDSSKLQDYNPKLHYKEKGKTDRLCLPLFFIMYEYSLSLDDVLRADRLVVYDATDSLGEHVSDAQLFNLSTLL